MNRPLFALLCAAAGLAGWGGMGWWRGAHGAGKTASLSPAAGATAPGEFARPGGKLSAGGKAGVSAIDGALTQARAVDLDDKEALAKLAALPPGAARDLAQLLLHVRQAARAGVEGPLFNPFADLPADAPPAAPWADSLRGKLLAGSAPGEPEFDVGDITRWAALDPAAASETILQMPAGKSRTAAVDAAAAVMARDNPQAAWDLVLKSGEQKLGEGAARAWLECTVSAAGTGDQPLAKVPATLREAVLNQTAALLNQNGTGTGSRTFTEGELSGLAAGLKGVAFGPGKEALWKAMMQQESFSADLIQSVMTVAQRDGRPHIPEMEALLGRQVAGIASADPAAALDMVQEALGAKDSGEGHLQLAAIGAAAPEIFPALARAGHVKEVAPLVERIPDAQQRRAALESILPQWMDADPAAARAAFQAAPFTALERERWLRHPAFLLNPEMRRE